MNSRVSAVVTRSAVHLSLALLAAGASACAGSSGVGALTAPSPGASSLTLTVSVQARTSEVPIEGALVRHHATGSYTDASGQSSINVETGSETTIDVSAPGYRPMGASAVVNSNERWTFFLEPNQTP